MKIYVLGHRGFISSHLIPKLLEKGHVVKTDPILHWGETFDVVINLAAKTHLNKGFDPGLIESNFILTQKVFERSERIVSISSCSARHPETSPYALSKAWMEHLSLQHNNSIALRIFNVYGVNARRGIVWWLLRQPNKAKIKLRGIDLIRDYITVENVVDFIVDHTLSSTKKIYPFNDRRQHFVDTKNKGIIDVGTKIGTSTMDLVNLYQKLSGKVFDISVDEPDPTDPAEMVAWNSKIANPTTLEEGLLKMINV